MWDASWSDDGFGFGMEEECWYSERLVGGDDPLGAQNLRKLTEKVCNP